MWHFVRSLLVRAGRYSRWIKRRCIVVNSFVEHSCTAGNVGIGQNRRKRIKKATSEKEVAKERI